MDKKKIKLTNKKREWISGYAFISLWLIGMIAFTIFPLFQAFFYSFSEAKFSGNQIITRWTWFENFTYAFTTDVKFTAMLVNYLTEIIVQVPFTIAVSLIIAMLLNQKIKFRAIWRVIFFLPVIIVSGPVISELINQGATKIEVFESGGFSNFITEYLPKILSNAILLLFDKLIIVLWYAGIPILIFLAGLQKINKQIYEAAQMDGASPWQSFWKITLPSMKPFIIVNAVYMIVTLSTSSVIQTDNQSIIDYIQEQMVGGVGKGYGYACALGVVYFFIILVQIGIYALIFSNKKKRGKRR